MPNQVFTIEIDYYQTSQKMKIHIHLVIFHQKIVQSNTLMCGLLGIVSHLKGVKIQWKGKASTKQIQS